MTGLNLLRGAASAFLLLMPVGVAGQTVDAGVGPLWEQLSTSDDTLALKAFIDIFPSSPQADAARARLDRLASGAEAARFEITDCDRLAAHPEDVDRRVAVGVSMDELRSAPEAAIDACYARALIDPSGRAAFQLARAYFAIDDQVSRRKWLQRAADAGYPRAVMRELYLLADGADGATPSVADYEDYARRFTEIGATYPVSYVKAARIHWDHLGGPREDAAQIVSLLERAVAGGWWQARRELALFALEDQPLLSMFDHVILLTGLIDDDQSSRWAQVGLALQIDAIFEMYRNGEFDRNETLTTTTGARIGEDGVMSEAEFQRVIDWMLDGIEFSNDVERLPVEDRMASLLRLLYVYPRTVPAQTLVMNRSDEPQSDDRIERMWASLCTIFRAPMPTETQKRQVDDLCRELRATYDTETMQPAMKRHDARLQVQGELAEVRRFLGRGPGDPLELRDCIEVSNTSRMPPARQGEPFTYRADVANRCPIPVRAVIQLRTYATAPNGKTDARLNGIVAPGNTERLTAETDTDFAYSGRWACHRLWQGVRSGGTLQCDTELNTGIQPIKGFVSSFGYVVDRDAILGRVGAIARGEVAGGAGPGAVGIPADQCALIVASRQTLAEAQSYIDGFPNTEEWFWKVFEARNGWLAISASLVIAEQSSQSLAELKRDGLIPDDSYCAKGVGFVRRLL
ncbi:hypothetical protein ACK8OR_00370 [Jannaschia sp. KMU-145]|uniref:hypothetical protein n=1 Tax=Jannaschia halovivens TaxID=3388667 RepID=UPI00396B1148